MSESAETTAAPEAPAKKRKGEQTQAHILETALHLFRERGYEDTTMRAIAEEAGVAVGNAYYYFRSKEHLIGSSPRCSKARARGSATRSCARSCRTSSGPIRWGSSCSGSTTSRRSAAAPTG